MVAKSWYGNLGLICITFFSAPYYKAPYYKDYKHDVARDVMHHVTSSQNRGRMSWRLCPEQNYQDWIKKLKQYESNNENLVHGQLFVSLESVKLSAYLLFETIMALFQCLIKIFELKYILLSRTHDGI